VLGWDACPCRCSRRGHSMRIRWGSRLCGRTRHSVKVGVTVGVGVKVGVGVGMARVLTPMAGIYSLRRRNTHLVNGSHPPFSRGIICESMSSGSTSTKYPSHLDPHRTGFRGGVHHAVDRVSDTARGFDHNIPRHHGNPDICSKVTAFGHVHITRQEQSIHHCLPRVTIGVSIRRLK